MTLKTLPFIFGPLQNNTILIYDLSNSEAAVIDPAMNCGLLLDTIVANNLHIKYILMTHGHFDHFGGLSQLLEKFPGKIDICLHKDDFLLWKSKGNANEFGFDLATPPDPSILVEDRQILKLGEEEIEVRYTPGHTPGHVVYYSKTAQTVFCGDLIFDHGVGRTDLAGGDFNRLARSIHEQIFPLPDETRLICGHGPETTVGTEKKENPFI